MVTSMLKWRLSLIILFTCTYAAATGTIDFPSKLCRFRTYCGMSEYGQLSMETQVHSEGESLLLAPYLGLLMVAFAESVSSLKSQATGFLISGFFLKQVS